MEGRKRELPYQRFTLTRRDKRITVNYSAGDHKILSYMADKEHKTNVEMAHELFIMGLECKQLDHKRRLAELEGKGKQ